MSAEDIKWVPGQFYTVELVLKSLHLGELSSNIERGTLIQYDGSKAFVNGKFISGGAISKAIKIGWFRVVSGPAPLEPAILAGLNYSAGAGAGTGVPVPANTEPTHRVVTRDNPAPVAAKAATQGSPKNAQATRLDDTSVHKTVAQVGSVREIQDPTVRVGSTEIQQQAVGTPIHRSQIQVDSEPQPVMQKSETGALSEHRFSTPTHSRIIGDGQVVDNSPAPKVANIEDFGTPIQTMFQTPTTTSWSLDSRNNAVTEVQPSRTPGNTAKVSEAGSDYAVADPGTPIPMKKQFESPTKSRDTISVGSENVEYQTVKTVTEHRAVSPAVPKKASAPAATPPASPQEEEEEDSAPLIMWDVKAGHWKTRAQHALSLYGDDPEILEYIISIESDGVANILRRRLEELA